MKELNFSPDNVLHRGRLLTPGEDYEALLRAENVSRHFDDLHAVLHVDQTYQALHDIHEIINEGSAKQLKLGDAFIDGGVVGIDIIMHYDPNIIDIMGANTAAFIEAMYDEVYRPNSFDDLFSQKRAEFIVTISRIGETGFRKFGAPFENALSRLYPAYRFREQQRTLRSGLGFVLDQAQRAQADDLAAFQNKLDEYDSPIGRYAQPLSELLADQALKMLDHNRLDH